MADMREINEILAKGLNHGVLDSWESRQLALYCMNLKVALKNLIQPFDEDDLDVVQDEHGLDVCMSVGNARAALVGIYRPEETRNV